MRTNLPWPCAPYRQPCACEACTATRNNARAWVMREFIIPARVWWFALGFAAGGTLGLICGAAAKVCGAP